MLKQLAPDLPGATSDNACSALPPDLVKFDGSDTTNAMQRYSQSISSCGAGTLPPTTLIASVKQADATGHPTTTDLSKLPATKIEVKFRTAVAPLPNAQHAYIEITRANGSKQDLAAYPKGGSLFNEGGQLQFEAGNEKPRCVNGKPDQLHVTKQSFVLSAPPGSSLTSYANALVDGAKNYNAHAVRYDGIGQQADRFNSNSFVSSLIVAKGGNTGLGDVRKIASEMDSGPVTIAGQAPTLSDKAMAERVRIDLDGNHRIAAGFGNARIEPARFEKSELAAATPPPWFDNTKDISAGAPEFAKQFLSAAGKQARKLWQHIFGVSEAPSTTSHR